MRSLRSVIVALALACGDEPGPIVNTARLTIEITGLPPGVDAQVQVEGPGNYGQLVPETRTFSELAPGTYVITASQVITGTGTYTPVPSTQTVNLVTDAEETASVVYSP